MQSVLCTCLSNMEHAESSAQHISSPTPPLRSLTQDCPSPHAGPLPHGAAAQGSQPGVKRPHGRWKSSLSAAALARAQAWDS